MKPFLLAGLLLAAVAASAPALAHHDPCRMTQPSCLVGCLTHDTCALYTPDPSVDGCSSPSVGVVVHFDGREVRACTSAPPVGVDSCPEGTGVVLLLGGGRTEVCLA